MQLIAAFLGALLSAAGLALPIAAQVDNTSPTIEVVEGTPADGAVVPAGLVQFAFSIEDDTSIARVRLRGLRSEPTIDNLAPDADGIYRYSAEFPPGQHGVAVTAVDGNGNRERTIIKFFAQPVGDTTAPEVSLYTFVNADDKLRFRVVVTDDVALRQNFYFIQNLDTGQYVQPRPNVSPKTKFSEELADGFTRLSGNPKFTQFLALPPGNYRAVAGAIDYAGNEADKVIRTFTIPG